MRTVLALLGMTVVLLAIQSTNPFPHNQSLTMLFGYTALATFLAVTVWALFFEGWRARILMAVIWGGLVFVGIVFTQSTTGVANPGGMEQAGQPGQIPAIVVPVLLAIIVGIGYERRRDRWRAFEERPT